MRERGGQRTDGGGSEWRRLGGAAPGRVAGHGAWQPAGEGVGKEWQPAGRREAAPGRECRASRGQQWQAAAVGWEGAAGGCSGRWEQILNLIL
jgi:hypothetical protein